MGPDRAAQAARKPLRRTFAKPCDPPRMNDMKLGILLWSQATDWPAFEEGARTVTFGEGATP